MKECKAEKKNAPPELIEQSGLVDQLLAHAATILSFNMFLH